MAESRDYLRAQQILDRLISGYEEDFAKYKKRVPVSRLREVFRYIVFQAGNLRPQQYYWHREKRGSNAEVDFLVQKNHEIIPIEIKSGMQGKMQSLRLFLEEKKISRGIRVSQENIPQYANIRVIPLYAVKNLFSDFQEM